MIFASTGCRCGSGSWSVGAVDDVSGAAAGLRIGTDAVDEDDDECEACINAANPSQSYDQVHFCERSLGNGVNFAEGEVPSFGQIAY